MRPQMPDVITAALIDKVFQVVSRFYGIPLEEIRGKERYRRLIEARFVGIALAKMMISQRYGWKPVAWYVKRDPSACSYAEARVKDWSDVEPDFAKRYAVVAAHVSKEVGQYEIYEEMK